MEYIHKSVLLDEAIKGLNIKEDGIYVDATLGGGGHSYEILKRVTKGKVIGIDQDDYALERASERLKEFSNFIPYKSNFSNIESVLDDLGIEKIDGIVFDLGVSSFQLDMTDRGFSYKHDAPLDMRMNQDREFTARELVNTYSEEDLSRIIRDYGEENWAVRIAKFIVQEREIKPIETTGELVTVIKKAVPKAARRDGPHPAKRTFQAIRIEVNGELEILKDAIYSSVRRLKKGGRISMISFHSLEDRIIKVSFKDLNTDCICPPELPICVCNHRRQIKLITRKPTMPSEDELKENPRARSAKLRIGEKCR